MDRNHSALAHETLLHACSVQKSFIPGFLTAVDARREGLSGIAGRDSRQEQHQTCCRAQLAFNNKRQALECFWLDAFLQRCVLGVDQSIAALNCHRLCCGANFQNSIGVSGGIDGKANVFLDVILKPRLGNLQVVRPGRQVAKGILPPIVRSGFHFEPCRPVSERQFGVRHGSA